MGELDRDSLVFNVSSYLLYGHSLPWDVFDFRFIFVTGRLDLRFIVTSFRFFLVCFSLYGYSIRGQMDRLRAYGTCKVGFRGIV